MANYFKGMKDVCMQYDDCNICPMRDFCHGTNIGWIQDSLISSTDRELSEFGDMIEMMLDYFGYKVVKKEVK